MCLVCLCACLRFCMGVRCSVSVCQYVLPCLCACVFVCACVALAFCVYVFVCFCLRDCVRLLWVVLSCCVCVCVFMS